MPRGPVSGLLYLYFIWRPIYIFGISLSYSQNENCCVQKLWSIAKQIKTHVLCSVNFCRKSCRLWDNVERFCKAGQATDDAIIRRMRIACWIPKATVTHSEHWIFTAFPQRQWFQERASMSRRTCIACLVFPASLRQTLWHYILILRNKMYSYRRPIVSRIAQTRFLFLM
jgi:hypothetical protein